MAGKRMATSKISKDDPEGIHAPSSGEGEEEDHGQGNDTVQTMATERKYLFLALPCLFIKCLCMASYLIGFLVLPSDTCPLP